MQRYNFFLNYCIFIFGISLLLFRPQVGWWVGKA